MPQNKIGHRQDTPARIKPSTGGRNNGAAVALNECLDRLRRVVTDAENWHLKLIHLPNHIDVQAVITKNRNRGWGLQYSSADGLGAKLPRAAEFDIESHQRRQNSQIGPSYLAAVPKQPVAGSDGASRRLEEWIQCGLAPAFPRPSVLGNPWPTPGACASARSKQNSFAESGVTTSGSTQRYDPGTPAELSPLAFLRMDSAKAIAAQLVPPLFPCPG